LPNVKQKLPKIRQDNIFTEFAWHIMF